jgi:iron-sulfur cluster repair protein YtfE (RIC family)
MKADQVLIEHHDVLRELLKKLGATTDEQGATRRKLLDELVRELGVHVRIEDELFYPAVQEVTPLLAISQAEHRAIDDQLAVVLRTDTAGPDFLVELEMLKETLDHHAGEEERVMFPQSHALGEEALEELGIKMKARQEHLRHSTVTQLLRAAKREVLRHA